MLKVGLSAANTGGALAGLKGVKGWDFDGVNGKHFIIKATGLSKKNIYVQKATLNGRPYTKSFIRHTDISKGGELVLYMGGKPSATWGTKKEDFPN